MKGYKLKAEGPHHYDLVHPDGSTFKVAKAGLSMAMHAQMAKMPRHLDEGGEADGAIAGDADPQPLASDVPADYLSGDMMGGDSPAALQAKMVNAANPDSQVPVPTDAPPSIAQVPVEAKPAAPDQVPMMSAQNGNPNIGDPTIKTRPGAKATDPFAPMEGAYNKAFGEMASGAKAGRDAQVAAANEMGQVQQNYVKQAQEAEAKRAAEFAQNEAENKKLSEDYANSKIDPGRVWAQASTGSKIAAGIGVLLSGIGSGLTGQKNMAMEVINNTIQRDMEAQRAELGKKENLLSQNYRKYGNIQAAYNATMANLYAVTQGQLAASAAKLQGGQANASYQQAMGELDMKRAEFQRQTALYTAFGQGGQPQGGGGVDLNRLRLGVAAGIIPKEQGTAALKEAGEYTKLQNSLGSLNQAFNTVDKLQTAGNRLGSPIQSKSQIDSTKELYSAQLAKDLEGRATPQDIASLMKNFPDLTDSEATKAQKRINLHNSIKSKFSFPTLEAYGLLTPNDPTTTPLVDISGGQTLVKGGR